MTTITPVDVIAAARLAVFRAHVARAAAESAGFDAEAIDLRRRAIDEALDYYGMILRRYPPVGAGGVSRDSY